MADVTVGVGVFAGFEYEMSVQYRGQTLTLISCPRGAKVEDVLAFAREAHGRMYQRNCDAVRVACEDERPASWKVNPVPALRGEAWLLVVVYELDTFWRGA